jgi:hypothetical protein
MDYQINRMQLTAECNRLKGVSEHILAFGCYDANEQVQLDHIDVRLRAIRRALHRLDDGTYGTCEVCGHLIGTARLDAMNDCSRCITCEIDKTRRRQSSPVSIN